ncbi:hypothetical protein Abr02nite_49180 [Paractinoplanes brasiliensis]|nr:hypothetical protein Abr02nite_49180 [Actinoplanes brasiliensis]
MPLLKLDRLCEGLEKGDWAGFLRDWDRALRAGITRRQPATTTFWPLVWASAALPGAVHDLTAARSHGIIDALTSADVTTFADKGCQSARGSVRTRSSGAASGRSCHAGRRRSTEPRQDPRQW